MRGPESPLDRLRVLLAERRRRVEVARRIGAQRTARYQRIAGELRAPFHEFQRRFYGRRPGQPRKRAACTTRQSGKTSGGTRETLARALEIPGQRWVYCIATREEAIKRAWRNDSAEGWVDLLRRFDVELADNRKAYDKGKGDVLVNEQLLTIEFRNGSQLDIFAADDERAANKLRGVQKDGVWVDEAQQHPGLEKFVDQVVEACLAKRGGELLLTGTPAEFLDGLFWLVTRDDDETARLPGWEVMTWSVLDNPGFGATRDERYARTLGLLIAEKRLDPDNLPPDIIREWLGKWVSSAARYVYRVQHKRDDELCFAPVRTAELPPALEVIQQLSREPIPWYHHEAALADLPRYLPHTKRPIAWELGLGVDFGFHPDPFALSLIAWTWDLPDLYEMWSWKMTRLYPTWQKLVLDWFWEHVPGIARIVGDPGGQAGAEMAGWQALTGLPIEPAQKSQKRIWIELRNDEISTGRYHYRHGSALLDEHKHLLWRPDGRKLVENADRKLQDGRVPGNHCSDADTYICRTVIGLRSDAPAPRPKYGSPEWAAAEEARMQATVGDLDQTQEGQGVEDIESWYGHY